MADGPGRPAERGSEGWKAGWEDQEANRLDGSLAATPAQRLAWLEEAIELAWATGALPAEDHSVAHPSREES